MFSFRFKSSSTGTPPIGTADDYSVTSNLKFLCWSSANFEHFCWFTIKTHISHALKGSRNPRISLISIGFNGFFTVLRNLISVIHHFPKFLCSFHLSGVLTAHCISTIHLSSEAFVLIIWVFLYTTDLGFFIAHIYSGVL